MHLSNCQKLRVSDRGAVIGVVCLRCRGAVIGSVVVQRVMAWLSAHKCGVHLGKRFVATIPLCVFSNSNMRVVCPVETF